MMDVSNRQLVLNVDGDEASRRTNSRALRAAGIEVEEAGSASEALAAVQRKPRVVLLGGALGDGNDERVVQRLRDAGSVPVVRVRSAAADTAGHGADAYFSAGAAPEELVDTVRAMLRLEGAEHAVRENERNYRVLVDSLTDGAFLAENDRLTFVNRSLAKMLGGASDAFVGMPLRALVVPAGGDGDGLGRLAAGGESAPVRCEVQLRGLDRRAAPIWTEIRSTRLRRDGAHAILGVVRDLTAQRETQPLQEQRADSLAEQNRRKDEFLAMLSHELRNPLAQLSNALALLRSGRSDAARSAELHAMMARQVEVLVRLVNDLLDVSRITRGLIQLQRRPLALSEPIARAVDSVGAYSASRGQQLEVALPAEPLIVDADVVRLTQVFFNLLHNAVKYTPPGGWISVSASREVEWAVVRVRDNGRGIAGVYRSRIFEPFVQGEHNRDRAQGGLGVGLTLAQRLVWAHGGRIEASSPGVGKGSEFVVRLRVADEAVAPAPAALAPRRAGGQRVLVVDDVPEVADSYAELLRELGHDTRIAYDGADALEIVASFAPHVVLADVGMPGMDGLELARRLRERYLPGDLRLVALTGYGDTRTQKLVAAAGFDDHLVKPAALDSLQRLFA